MSAANKEWFSSLHHIRPSHRTKWRVKSNGSLRSTRGRLYYGIRKGFGALFRAGRAAPAHVMKRSGNAAEYARSKLPSGNNMQGYRKRAGNVAGHYIKRAGNIAGYTRNQAAFAVRHSRRGVAEGLRKVGNHVNVPASPVLIKKALTAVNNAQVANTRAASAAKTAENLNKAAAKKTSIAIKNVKNISGGQIVVWKRPNNNRNKNLQIVPYRKQ